MSTGTLVIVTDRAKIGYKTEEFKPKAELAEHAKKLYLKFHSDQIFESARFEHILENASLKVEAFESIDLTEETLKLLTV